MWRGGIFKKMPKNTEFILLFPEKHYICSLKEIIIRNNLLNIKYL